MATDCLWICVLFGVLASGLGESRYSAETRLRRTLFGDSYEKTVIPMNDSKNNVTLEMAVTLVSIDELDVTRQVLKTHVRIRMQWTDVRLTWNPDQYDELNSIIVPASLVWKPDIIPYNIADTYTPAADFWMVVKYSGEVVYLPHIPLTTTCSIDLKHFPFDEQTCELLFGTWTYNADQMKAFRFLLVTTLIVLLTTEPSEAWFRLRRVWRRIVRHIRIRWTYTHRFQSEQTCDSIQEAMIKRQEWNALAPRDDPTPINGLPSHVTIWHTGDATCTLLGLSQASCNECIQDGSCVNDLILALQKSDLETGKNDIRYNFLVGQNGVIYEGRGWGVIGENLEGHVIQSVAMAMIGNFDESEPSQASQNALADLIRCGQLKGHLAGDIDLISSPEMSGKALDDMIQRCNGLCVGQQPSP